jgi:hypothetical protein
VGGVKADTWTTVDYPEARSTQVTAISGDTIAGTYTDASGATHGFFHRGNTWTSFDAPGGATAVQVTGIDSSTLIGFYGTNLWWNYSHGFIYDGYSMTTFDFPGATFTQLCGIDGSNIIGSADRQYFLYNLSTQNKTILDIPGPPHGIDGTNIVGFYDIAKDPFDFVEHGFIYNGTSWNTLDMPSAAGTRLWGISGNNIVGSGSGSFVYNMTADSWTSLNIPGSKAMYVQGIDGDKVVGFYIDSTFRGHGFIYTIPEPATLSLLAIGGLLLRKRK